LLQIKILFPVWYQAENRNSFINLNPETIFTFVSNALRNHFDFHLRSISGVGARPETEPAS
jgi:hypothetical protein